MLPDRNAVTMAAPCMRAYSELLVQTCHRRGAFAMGGMAAFIPSRRDAEVNERAFAKVREDKTREAAAGFDGSWVAHPDLVAVCAEVFGAVLGDRPNQLDKQRPDVDVTAADLLDIPATPGEITRAGLRSNIDVALRYLAAWLGGLGAVGIHNLMEDAATAEISRSQIWQWLRNSVTFDDGATITRTDVDDAFAAVRDDIRKEVGDDAWASGNYEQASALFMTIALASDFAEFLTLPAYELID